MNILEKVNSGAYDTKKPYASILKDKKTYNAYMEDECRLSEEFKADLETEFEMKNHPKANLLYMKAYEFGHSSGFSEIYHYYAQLVELVK